jgi:hypothetical protein
MIKQKCYTVGIIAKLSLDGMLRLGKSSKFIQSHPSITMMEMHPDIPDLFLAAGGLVN